MEAIDVDSRQAWTSGSASLRWLCLWPARGLSRPTPTCVTASACGNPAGRVTYALGTERVWGRS